MSSSYQIQSHNHSVTSATLNVPQSDVGSQRSWSAGYDQSPYAASAESFSPSSSSNHGGMSDSRKLTAACGRCRRHKMKCVYKDGMDVCSRCYHAKAECKKDERKLRNPGELEQVRGTLRNISVELDQAIDDLRAKNASQYETPLSVIPGRIVLSSEQKEELREVLGNLSGTASGRKVGSGVGMEDVKALLEMEGDVSDDEEASGNESVDAGSDGTENQARSSGMVEHAGSSESAMPKFDTPLGFIMQTTLEEEADKEGFFQENPLKNASLRSILIERGDEAPQIMTNGLFTLKEVEALFDLYFKHIHPIVALLDPAIHTPSSVLLRSSFLFTVVCTIACRFADEPVRDTQVSQQTAIQSKSKKRTASQMETTSPVAIKSRSKKSTIHGLAFRYPLALHFAKAAAASALIDGRKNVEMIQAYLLMALYAPNGKRFEESRTLFYSGVASTLALELGLHRITERCPGDGKDERAAREWNNLIRTWIVCFNLDRCYSVQYGKPMVLTEDYHVLNKNSYHAPYAISYDIHLHGHTDLLRIMARFHHNIRAEKIAKRIPMMIESFEKEVDDLALELKEEYLREADMTDEGCRFRLCLAEFVTNYSRLLILSHGLQQSFDNGSPPDKTLLANALRTATAAINSFVDKIASTGFWRYSPDCYFIYAGYCSTFLLKLIDSKFPSQFDDDQKERIVELVSKLVDTLSAPEIVIDERHTPKLYAGFLAGLLGRVRKEVRESKRLRLDQERDAHSEMAATVSPPPSSTNSITASPNPQITVVESPVSYTDVSHGIGYVNNSQNVTLSAFPNMYADGQSFTGSSIDNTTFPSGDWESTLATDTNISWEDVHNIPMSMQVPVQMHPDTDFTHLATGEHSGHSMTIGTQWNFSNDENLPYTKWSMEDLCPTVHNLMPTVHQFC